MHVTKDIPEMIKEAERIYPDVEFVYTSLSVFTKKLAKVIMERIASARGLLPQDIEKKSFEIISGD